MGRGWILLIVATGHWACGAGPAAPTDPVLGNWHGTAVTQTAGPVLGVFSKEDILLNAGGIAEIVEYEGSRRSDTGTWVLTGTEIVLDFPTFCDRRGTIANGQMSLTCTLDTRTWALSYEKR